MTFIASGRGRVSAGNGAVTAFAVPFQYQAGGLFVYLLAADSDAAALAMGPEDGTLLSEGSDYTLAGDGEAGAAVVTTVATYAAGQYVLRWRLTSRDQAASYVPGPFPALPTQRTLDRAAMALEEVDDDRARFAARAQLVPPGETPPPVPAIAGRIGKFRAWDADGNEIAASGTGGDAALRADLAAAGGAALVGTAYGALDRKLGQFRAIEDFLDADYDYSADDASAAIVAAAAWSAANNRTIAFAGRYRIETPAVVTDDLVRLRFDGARFDIAAALTDSTTTRAATGPIAFHFKGADKVHLSGSARFISEGTLHETQICGICFDDCDYVNAAGFSPYFQTMAAGMMIFDCNFGKFGPIQAYQMDGRQTFDATVDAGTALDIASCTDCQIGDVQGIANWKPTVYFSTVSGGVDNNRVTVGDIQIVGASGSLEATGVAFRRAQDCSVGVVTCQGPSQGASFVQYDTDTGFACTGNHVAGIIGSFPATGASADAIVEQTRESSAAPVVGSNSIGFVKARSDIAAELGITVSSGELSVGTAEINGSRRPAAVYNGTLRLGSLIVRNHNQAAITVGPGGYLDCGLLDIRSGTSGTGPAVVGATYDGSYATGIAADPATGGRKDIKLRSIRYQRGGGGFTDLSYGILDVAGSIEQWGLGDVAGSFGTNDAQCGGSDFRVRGGQAFSAALPAASASISYTRGFHVRSSVATTGAPSGWVNKTASQADFVAMADL